MTREERIMAYADGELDAAAATAFELEMRHDPTMAEEVEAQRVLRRRVAEAFAPVLAEPVPAHLVAAANRAGRPPSRRLLGPPAWAAMAACLALGVFVGRMTLNEGPLAPARDGTLVARGDLAKALDVQLSGRGAPVEVSVSFRARDGRYCRVFHSAPDRLDGLACRRSDRWTMQSTARAKGAVSAADYRMAASSVSPEVLAAAERLMAGEALDRRAEAAARDARWR